jgi:hypothetical protein
MANLDPELQTDETTVISGVFMAWGLNFVHLIATFLGASGSGAGYMLVGFPLIQYVYIVPLVLSARSAGYHDRAKGLIIGSSITLLLTGACFGGLYLAIRG